MSEGYLELYQILLSCRLIAIFSLTATEPVSYTHLDVYKRQPSDKRRYDKASRELKTLIKKLKNESLKNFLENLTNTAETDYSIWQATRNLKHPKNPIPPIRKEDGSWARTDHEKATTFGLHLEKVFQPLPSQNSSVDDADIENFLQAPYRMSPLPKFLTFCLLVAAIFLPRPTDKF